MLTVIYEDNHLLVVEKPPNIPIQADESGDTDLLTMAKAYIKHKYNKPGEVYLGLVHRLDRPVGGVVVFARTSKAASRLTDQFASRRTAKRYLAIVEGEPPGGRLEGYISRDERTGTARLYQAERPGAKFAALSYFPCSRAKGRTLLSVELFTGRHHQIRLQLSGAGYPIWGDQRYNPHAKPGQQIALFAASLTLSHPTLHRDMTFTSLPRGGGWQDFSDAIPAAAQGIGIAYIDEDIIVPFKPAGMTTAMADGGEDSLEQRLREIYGEAAPAHRLDANTTGLVLFARSGAALDALTSAIKKRLIRKIYRLTVRGRPRKMNGELVSYGKKDAEKGLVTVYDSPAPGAVEMVSKYRVISTEDGLSVIEAELITGRTHQLRAQFAHIGCPILGDDRYGDRELNRRFDVREQALSATEIRLGFEPSSCLARLDGAVLRL